MDIFGWIMLTIFIVIAIYAIWLKLVKPFVMSTPEERKTILLEYLYSLIVIAEKDIQEGGMGSVKLRYVQDLFLSNAPLIYRLFLRITCKDNLTDLIEEALATIKSEFEKAE